MSEDIFFWVVLLVHVWIAFILAGAVHDKYATDGMTSTVMWFIAGVALLFVQNIAAIITRKTIGWFILLPTTLVYSVIGAILAMSANPSYTFSLMF